MTAVDLFTAEAERLDAICPMSVRGRVAEVVGLTAAVSDFTAPMGALCRLHPRSAAPVHGEVIGFRGDRTLVMPFGDLRGIGRGDRVELVSTEQFVRIGPEAVGRVFNATGKLIDGKEQVYFPDKTPLHRAPPDPLRRERVSEPLGTGIRTIDALLTVGKGQRMGIFAGSGVGKSVLLGMMARYTDADVNVVGLVGERGREVRDFIEKDLGPEGLARTVLVVATGDEPALRRVRAVYTASAIAEYFRDQGKDVLLMVDSITRFAMAQREIGLAAGEPPTTRSFTPSVFSLLPKVLERSGRAERGAITGLYTVLVEGDDANEPISDAVRSILDGHCWLSRKLANRGHYPAIDVLESTSRLMIDLVDQDHFDQAQTVLASLAAYRDAEDLISINAYNDGDNPEIDLAKQTRDQRLAFLRQRIEEGPTFQQNRQALAELAQIHQQTAQTILLRRQHAARTPASAAPQAPPSADNRRVFAR
jgi:flagellum-specific ATP synthase